MPLEDLIAAKKAEQDEEEAEGEGSDDEADKKGKRDHSQKPPETTNHLASRMAPEADPSLLGGWEANDAGALAEPMDAAAADRRLGDVAPPEGLSPIEGEDETLQTRNIKCMNPKCKNRFDVVGYMGEMISKRCDQCKTINKIIMKREGNTINTKYIGNEPQNCCLRCTSCIKVDRKVKRDHCCWCCGACQCCLCCPQGCFLHGCSCSIQ
mmetsp:Transcript_3224/g.8080  ORF Transcript_3224/g.8080 Transcript_3224/m.8080 type:complete len:210 (-) Transcript_3224:1648-2277(-)